MRRYFFLTNNKEFDKVVNILQKYFFDNYYFAYPNSELHNNILFIIKDIDLSNEIAKNKEALFLEELLNDDKKIDEYVSKIDDLSETGNRFLLLYPRPKKVKIDKKEKNQYPLNYGYNVTIYFDNNNFEASIQNKKYNGRESSIDFSKNDYPSPYKFHFSSYHSEMLKMPEPVIVFTNKGTEQIEITFEQWVPGEIYN